MPINFPASPTLNQIYTYEGKSWQWNGAAWDLYATVLGSNVNTFLATPTSANLAAAVTDETGSGALVFATSPTISSPIITGLFLNDSSIIFEGSSADEFETTLTVTNPTADRTITLPNATGTVALQGFIPSGLTWGDLKNGKSA